MKSDFQTLLKAQI